MAVVLLLAGSVPLLEVLRLVYLGGTAKALAVASAPWPPSSAWPPQPYPYPLAPLRLLRCR
jgi:hypothetical protein